MRGFYGAMEPREAGNQVSGPLTSPVDGSVHTRAEPTSWRASGALIQTGSSSDVLRACVQPVEGLTPAQVFKEWGAFVLWMLTACSLVSWCLCCE